jgi:hypothetical protein
MLWRYLYESDEMTNMPAPAVEINDEEQSTEILLMIMALAMRVEA